MYVERVPNRNSPPAVLLRQSYRDGDKVRKRTLANLSDWSDARIERLREVLRGEPARSNGPGDEVIMLRSLPHGHVAAVLGTARKIGLDRLLAAGKSPARLVELVLAMVVARVIAPASKLATARHLDGETAGSSLGPVLKLGTVDEQELYAALDWLVGRQPRIEQRLAARHLKAGTLVLYDVTSTYFEGHTCPLARHGYSRDSQRSKLQIVVGLLCAADGCPVAIEVFEGNMADPTTLTSQVAKLKQRFRLDRVVLVGDRGMITAARIEQLLEPAGLDWLTALRAPAIKALAEGPLQLSLFDQKDLAEIQASDYPGQRLIACRNPLLAAERARKRGELLAAAEDGLAKVAAAITRKRRPVRGQAAIAVAAARVLDRRKMAKHFVLTITDDSLTYTRNQQSIAREAALDGIYVIRTSVPDDAMAPDQIVAAYKNLSRVERAFRSIKTVDLEIRPIHHRLADRVRAHVFLCMLAYYLEWHIRQPLAPILFDDHQPDAAIRDSIVAPAQRSEAAHRKAAHKRTADGLPVQSFQSLLADLATFSRNTMALASALTHTFLLYPKLTPLQLRAFDLLGVPPRL